MFDYTCPVTLFKIPPPKPKPKKGAPKGEPQPGIRKHWCKQLLGNIKLWSVFIYIWIHYADGDEKLNCFTNIGVFLLKICSSHPMGGVAIVQNRLQGGFWKWRKVLARCVGVPSPVKRGKGAKTSEFEGIFDLHGITNSTHSLHNKTETSPHFPPNFSRIFNGQNTIIFSNCQTVLHVAHIVPRCNYKNPTGLTAGVLKS